MDPDEFLPLPPAALHIMLALAGRELHGYAIIQDVLRQSDGRYKLGPGTLYDNLQRMLEQGLVEEVERPRVAQDPRRRCYRLSRLGKRVVEAEMSRLEGVIRDTRVRIQTARA